MTNPRPSGAFSAQTDVKAEMECVVEIWTVLLVDVEEVGWDHVFDELGRMSQP